MFFAETISVGVSAWVFFALLTAPGMVLEFWYKALERLAENGWAWIAKPLGYCGVCFSGQCGFWWYLVESGRRWQFSEHAIFTCQTVFFFWLANEFSKKIERKW